MNTTSSAEQGCKNSQADTFLTWNSHPPRYLYLVTWCWFLTVFMLVITGLSEVIPKTYLFLVVFAYSSILLRPFSESPFWLMLLTVGPTDNFIFLGGLIFLLRSIFFGKLYIPKVASGYAYFFLLVVVIFSTLLSSLTVELRPLQAILWSVTFLIPLTLAVARYRCNYDGHALTRFGIMLIVLQLLPATAAIPSYLSIGSPDVFGGTWLDADILGFWGTALMMGAGVLALIGKHPRRAKRKFVLLAIIGGVLAAAASGKIYSVFIIGIGLLFLIISTEFIQGVLNGRIRTLVLVVIGSAGTLLVALVIANQLEPIKEWATYQFEHSHKVVFLDRVFNQMDTYGYSNLFGVGPGMLGSRAANAVSSDVLHKEEVHLPQILQGAPQPEARIMSGLFDLEFQEGVRYMSANMVIPFSGIGAVKGELGWIGLVVVLSLFCALFWPYDLNRNKHISKEQLLVYIMASASGLSVVFLSLFDTAWEQPKIMVFLAMLMIAAKASPIYIQKEKKDG